MGKLENILVEKFGSVYDAFSEVSAKGISILDNLNIPQKALTVIAELGSKIQVPHVEIRGIFELTCNKSNGIEIIKHALIDSTASKKEISVTYIGAPKYRITLTSPNFKEAEKELKPILSSVQDAIEKKGGTFKFTREESKKTREG
jgi:translation initiation factor 2 subunit 1